VATWLLFGAAPAEAQPAVPHILVLQSLNRGNLSLDSFSSNFRIDLEARAGRPVTIVQFVVGPTGFVAAPEQALIDYIRATFASGPAPDLNRDDGRSCGDVCAQASTVDLSRDAAPIRWRSMYCRSDPAC
jgi:hypothetical protein